MTAETVTIVLPLPDKWLSPNKEVASRGARMRKHLVAAKARAAAKTACLACGITDKWQKAICHYAFWYATNRRHDAGNSVQHMKSAIDGCVDAGIIPDDDWKHLSIGRVEFGLDKVNPRVELTFERVE